MSLYNGRGFTLLEVVFTLSLATVLAAIVVPSFSAIIQKNRRVAFTNNFIAAVHLARSTAAREGLTVALCRAARDEGCEGVDAPWVHGWRIFVNYDRDVPPHIDEDEPVVQYYRADPHIELSSNRQAYSFRPFGRASTNGTVVFCDPRGHTPPRAVIISNTGRPRVSTAYADGTPLNCGD